MQDGVNKLSYLSPTSVNMCLGNPEEFFLKYMCKAPKEAQTVHMAAGNAFDACIKAYLEIYRERDVTSDAHRKLYEHYLKDAVEDKTMIDTMRDYGIVIFNKYKHTGALDWLLADAERESIEPLDKVQTVIQCPTLGGMIDVPILGKPDLNYISKSQGYKITTDWKCNGAMSQYSISPLPGYVDLFPSRAMHKDCLLVDGVNTLDMHKAHQLQLCTYSLLTGAHVVGIDQLVFSASTGTGPMGIGACRVAIHRHKVSEWLVNDVKEKFGQVWSLVDSWLPGQPFGEITAERCLELQGHAFEMGDPVKRMLFGR